MIWAFLAILNHNIVEGGKKSWQPFVNSGNVEVCLLTIIFVSDLTVVI